MAAVGRGDIHHGIHERGCSRYGRQTTECTEGHERKEHLYAMTLRGSREVAAPNITILLQKRVNISAAHRNEITENIGIHQ